MRCPSDNQISGIVVATPLTELTLSVQSQENDRLGTFFLDLSSARIVTSSSGRFHEEWFADDRRKHLITLNHNNNDKLSVHVC